jgi:hypothetical protein
MAKLPGASTARASSLSGTLRSESMSRWKAAGIHLGISACVAACAALLIFFVWYPSPYTHAAGADQLVVMLLGIDIILGPLLTLVVYKRGKKSLRFDLTVIALLQVCAFAYGMSIVVRARPAFIVSRIDRFVLVTANDLDDADLAKGSKPEFQSIPWTGPRIVGAVLPTDIDKRNALAFSGVGGKDLERFPQYYVDYDQAAPALLSRAKPLADLIKAKPQAAQIIGERFDAGASDVVWLPLTAPRASMTMMLDRNTGKPLGALPVDPW